jgi:hypothetical protein
MLDFGFWMEFSIQNSEFKISQPVRPFPVRRYFCRRLLGLSVGMAGIVQTGGDAFQAGFELFLGRQVELVFRGEDIGIGRESELNQGIVFTVAKEDADGRRLVGQLHMPIEVIHIYPVR